jgi:hypothetical protein
MTSNWYETKKPEGRFIKGSVPVDDVVGRLLEGLWQGGT